MNRALTAYLAVTFAKARPVRGSAVAVAVIVATVMMLLASVQAFQQSGAQAAQVSTGKADYMLSLPISEPSGEDAETSDAALFDAMRQDGGVDPRSGFDIYQVPIDGHFSLWMNLSEHNWEAEPFPGRYLLQDGRLPSEPGEVAISQALADELDQGGITLADGAFELKVVGVVRDESNRSAPFGLVQSGTWALAGETAGTFNVTGTRSLYWNSNEPPDQVVKAIALELSTTNVDVPPLDEFMLSLSDRRALLGQGSRLYSELAVLILLAPIAAGLISGWLGSRFITRVRETLLQIGIARTAPAGTAAIAGSTLVSVLVGIGVGLLGGHGLRPLLDTFSNQELGPIYGLEFYAPAVIGATLVGMSLGMLSVLQNGQRMSQPNEERQWPSLMQLLPALGAAFLFAGIFCAQSSDLNIRFLSPFLFGFAVVVFAPYALRLVVRIRSDSLPVTAAIRRLNAERQAASGVTVGLASVLMLSLSVLLVNFSIVTSVNDQLASRVPQGQLQLSPLDRANDIERLRGEIEEFASVSRPVSLAAASVSPNFLDGPVMVVKTPHDVERLLEVSLTPEQARSLEGGALLRHKASPAETEVLTFDDGTTATLPVLELTEAVTNHNTFGGFIAQTTADRLKIPTVQQSWVYTELNDRQLQLLLLAPEEFGFDPGWVVAYAPPQPRSESPQNLLIAFGSGLIASLLVAYYASTNTRRLRPTLAALHAIGVRSRWLTIVSVVQIGAVVFTAVSFAWVGALLAAYLSTQTWISGTQLHVPWASTGVLLGTLIVLAAIFMLHAKRKLSSLER